MNKDVKTLLLVVTGIWFIDRLEQSGLNPLDPASWWRIALVREAPRIGSAVGDIIGAGVADIRANPPATSYDDGSYGSSPVGYAK